MEARVMIMAGGTGGHVFPALAVAEELQARGVQLCWLGNPQGFEAGVVAAAGIRFEPLQVQGLRGSSLLRRIKAPFVLLYALWQARQAIRRFSPCAVLGMGGYVAGPGGVASWLMRKPLIIHEQNAIAGLTNRLLAHVATYKFQAFENSFDAARLAVTVGNPVRKEIATLPWSGSAEAGKKPNLLVIGGSLGAQALNETVPQALALLQTYMRPNVRHQSGRDKDTSTFAAYAENRVEADIKAFIEDMAEALAWADIVICRAGALTLTELMVTGLPSILVPYPYAVDDHQSANASSLVEAGAAIMIQQSELSAQRLSEQLLDLLNDPKRLQRMALAARELARPDAAQRVADACVECCR
ncbi:MAG: undecaprenyldiphospho-muramoylpentapeptide beta-N-acetylglucosaminyltransferase [gamma proteobacterium symbiont of Bathyaustriella thionipta]|nr:undecaprenyldiphospho-muramoylpentapeptide beta-N-acetylglucosaminyltransferase [gamma proteobacterium symbiont of Bathyaustriella thionipta]